MFETIKSKSKRNYYLQCAITIPADSITINEFKVGFFSLKTNKSPGYDEISANVIKNCIWELIFEKSMEKGLFPDALKIARVTPLFKDGDPSDVNDCSSLCL